MPAQGLPHPMSKHYASIREAAKAQFEQNLKHFFDSFASERGWTNSSLLRAAGMDLSLITRISENEGFNVTALDRLQETMDDILDGKIKTPPPKPKPRSKK
jgi:hypothetical protein